MDIFATLSIAVLLIASIHMMAPDHWLPIVLVSRERKYDKPKKYFAVLSIGSLHALSSIAVSLVALYVTKVFFAFSTGAVTDFSAALMVAIGAYFIYSSRKEDHEPMKNSYTGILSVSTFPDITFLPLLLTSISLLDWQQIFITVEFLAVTIVSLLLVVLLLSPVMEKGLSRIPERYMDSLIGVILIILAGVVVFL